MKEINNKQENVKVTYITSEGKTFKTITPRFNIVKIREKFLFVEGYENSRLNIIRIRNTRKSSYSKYCNIN